MGRNSVTAAALLTLVAAATGAAAADLCDGCWEVGARGAWLAPSGDAGSDPAAGAGVFAAFRFRPYWSVEFALDRHPTGIPQGPDETYTFFSAAFTYTFRAAREQRTRPYAFFSAGLAHDAVDGDRAVFASSSGPVSVSSSSDSDTRPLYGLGAGGLTSIGERTFLRYEARMIRYSSFGIGQKAIDLLLGVAVRLGR